MDVLRKFVANCRVRVNMSTSKKNSHLSPLLCSAREYSFNDNGVLIRLAILHPSLHMIHLPTNQNWTERTQKGAKERRWKKQSKSARHLHFPSIFSSIFLNIFSCLKFSSSLTLFLTRLSYNPSTLRASNTPVTVQLRGFTKRNHPFVWHPIQYYFQDRKYSPVLPTLPDNLGVLR